MSVGLFTAAGVREALCNRVRLRLMDYNQSSDYYAQAHYHALSTIMHNHTIMDKHTSMHNHAEVETTTENVSWKT